MTEQYGYSPANPTESVDAAILQRDALRAFAQDIMRAWPDGGVDGGELQEAAVRHGLLVPSDPTQEERDEWGFAEDEIVEWYRPGPLLSPNANCTPKRGW